MSYARFAIYFIPPDGPMAEFGANWLGWDVVAGRNVQQFDIPGLQEATKPPQKYGFHGTLKPPFRLQDGKSFDELKQAVTVLAKGLAPAICDGLELTPLGRFLALTPKGPTDDLQQVAAACVRELDVFRAPATAAELDRRRKAGLSARQDALLIQWGYPYVFEEFRFHLTLTGKLPQGTVPHWTEIVAHHLPEMPTPFLVDQIALCGEREDGHFELIQRYALGG